MHRIFLALPVFFVLLLPGFFPASPGITDALHANRFNPSPCDSIPELNRKIIELVTPQMGKTIGRGECWDLAALVLNQTGAKWDKHYTFGRKVDPDKECVYPGDLIQFEGVKIKYSEGQRIYTETMAHHTAVIYQVKTKGVFTLAHQNTATSGRTVGLSDLDLKTIIKGKFQIYRPVR